MRVDQVMTGANSTSIDPGRFRQVLGNYPTGVAVITAIDADGSPAGMAVGTFTSVSLDPPLVSFLPDRNSYSFSRIRTATSFCVNVLASHQDDLCRAFASRNADKFAGVAWSPAPSGAPLLQGAAAWIDCDFESITNAGDHFLVVGQVREFDGAPDELPLVFFQGGYGRFSPHSMVAIPEPDMIGHLRHADLARPQLERIAEETGAVCIAVAAVGDHLVVVASAGAAARGVRRTPVGQRSPFLAPLGALFVAAASGAEVEAWLIRATELDDERRTSHLAQLERVRDRGWSMCLASDSVRQLEAAFADYSVGGRDSNRVAEIRRLAAASTEQFEPAALEPGTAHDVRLISVPVVGPDGTVILVLTLSGLPKALSEHQIENHADRLRNAAKAIEVTIVGCPEPPLASARP